MEKINPRIQHLEFLLERMDKIHLREAAKLLHVSEMTIRRDLSNDTSSVQLLGGYIVRNVKQNKPHSYVIFEHQDKNIAEKMQIGQQAASLIKENDVVFFDCGSTIPFIASQIDNGLKFTALCCSINTFLVLKDKPNCRLILCGGYYSQHNAFLTPLQATNELDAICTDKAFISAAGIDIKQGVTCFSLEEAKVKQKAMLKTQQKILVADGEKFHRIEQAYIANIADFDQIISDQALPAEFQNQVQQI